MKSVVAALMLVTSVSACATERPAQDCETLWRGQRWHQAEEPIWVTPSVPDQGVVPTLKMWALIDASGSRFVPANIEESNCLLDRILDGTTRASIRDAGAALAARVSAPDIDKDVDLLLNEAARRVDAAVGIGKEESSPARTLSSILVNLQSQYEIRPGPVSDPGRFLRFAYGQRLYNSYTVTWYVLLSYVAHLGVRPFHMDAYLEQLRARDSQYAPPGSLQAEGCPALIDYQWPHIDRPLPSQTDLPDDAALHFGVCRSSKTIWFFPVNQRWHPLNDKLESEFCSEWGDDRQFAEVCKSPNND